MGSITITSAQRIIGDISVPGDKSISHRALLLGAIANGRTTISGLSCAADVQSTRSCLEHLGVKTEQQGDEWIIEGVGKNGLRPPEKILNAGNSGTTIRLLSGILAGQHFTSSITGDESLCKRPMNRIIEPLGLMGTSIASENGFPPLTISGGSLRPIDYTLPVASAQVKSCILLAGMFARGTTIIHQSAQSRDHTERMLQDFGATLYVSKNLISMRGPVDLFGTSCMVPGDISSAAFFMIAASILPGSSLSLSNVGLNPTRTGVLDVLGHMGLTYKIDDFRTITGEPAGRVTITSQNLHATDINGDIIPRVIDEIPILAVAATQAQGKTRIQDAKELRVKETDRIAATCANLRKMGAKVDEFEDGLDITGPCRLNGATLDSFGDHRIAMAFAVAGLLAEGETTITNPDCVEISYPNFFQELDSLCHD